MRANWAWPGRMAVCSMSGLVISSCARPRTSGRAACGVSPSYVWRGRGGGRMGAGGKVDGHEPSQMQLAQS
jgi:hypothetical protein